MRSKIIWFTGLSGSGKSTLSNYISKKLRKKFKVLKIDGDTFRKKKKIIRFTKEAIIQNNMAIINYISKRVNKYEYILVSVISPLKKTRIYAHKKFGKNYYEVNTNCNLNELIRRDTKKLYLKAKQKKINDLIGYNSIIKYEKTKYKKIIINTAKEKVAVSANKILKKLIYEKKV